MYKFKYYLQLIRFDKPIGTLLLLWPTLWALFIASNGIANIKYIIIFTMGTFLTRSAGCAFNDLADYNFDKHVNRTKNRPLANGMLSKKQALLTGISLSVIALILALSTLTINTILLTIPAFLIYATYPLFKRFFAIPQLYLGVAYSFGIFMAFMQIQNDIPLIAWLIFIANLLWTTGYDTIYALVDIDDDLKIDIKTSAITFDKLVTPIIAFCYTIFVLIMIFVGLLLQLHFYYYGGLFIAFGFILQQIYTLIKQHKQLYFKMFLINNKVGFSIFLGILTNYL